MGTAFAILAVIFFAVAPASAESAKSFAPGHHAKGIHSKSWQTKANRWGTHETPSLNHGVLGRSAPHQILSAYAASERCVRDTL
jgi:hypothetical protein